MRVMKVVLLSTGGALAVALLIIGAQMLVDAIRKRFRSKSRRDGWMIGTDWKVDGAYKELRDELRRISAEKLPDHATAQRMAAEAQQRQETIRRLIEDLKTEATATSAAEQLIRLGPQLGDDARRSLGKIVEDVAPRNVRLGDEPMRKYPVEVLCSVVHVLGAIEHGSIYSEEVRRLLQWSGNTDVIVAAAEALGNMRDYASVRSLMTLLALDEGIPETENDRRQEAAHAALKKINSLEARPAVDTYEEWVGRGKSRVFDQEYRP